MRESFILVDDEKHWVDFAEPIFLRKGFRFAHYYALQDALSFLARGYADFLLVNFDLVLEWEELENAVRGGKVRKAVVLSNVHSVSSAVEAFRRGLDYADKPFGEEELAALIDRLLADNAGKYMGTVLSPVESQVGMLVVEDLPEWQRIFTGALANIPRLEVTVVDNYEDAVDALAKRLFHIIIVDIRLLDEDSRNIDGFILLKNIYKSNTNVVMIVTSGFATVELARDAMLKYNAFDFFLKSPDSGQFELERFRSSIRQALDKLAVADAIGSVNRKS